MKNAGCKFEYQEQRDRDLLRAFREQLAQKDAKNIWDALERAVNSPASRFWVSEYRAASVIAAMMRGADISRMTKMKQEMFTEIYSRVKVLMQKRPKDNLLDIVCSVVNSPAPKFYLTRGSANVIIHKAKKRWKKQRQQP